MYSNLIDNNAIPFKDKNKMNQALLNNKVKFNILSLNLTILSILLLLFFIFCFLSFLALFKRKVNNIIALSEEKEIDINYTRIYPNDEEFVYIPIVGTSDFHGRFFPEENMINYNSKKIIYKTGGLEYIAKYINILRDEFGSNRVLYFDIGDQFFHTNETILFDGNNIIEFLNKIGLNGTTLGNHEFIYRREWIENKIKKANYPYIINNIKDKNTNKKKGILGKNQETSHLYEIKLENGDIIKIGVIGITLKNGVDKTFHTVGNKHTWDDLIFQSYETDLEKESKNLREKGANAIILLSHIGLLCNNISETSKINMYNKTMKQSECEHEGDSLLYKLLNKIKPGMIDGIIGGDTHTNVHHWVNDIPIMISTHFSKYLNIMYLPFKKNFTNNKYILINDEIKIEGPIPSCEKIFSNLNHCEKLNNPGEFENSGNLVNFVWHGKRIEKDIMTKKLFDKYYSLYKNSKENNIVKLMGFNDKIKIDLSGDSLLGNLMMDTIRQITDTDISIVNFWMFQNEVYPGVLTLFDFIKLMPYENYICITEITGNEIFKMIKTVQNGKRGYQPTSGLKQFIKIKNGKKEVIDVQIYKNGKAINIDKNKVYTLSSNNYVLSEENEDEFHNKDFLDIIKDKKRNNKIHCSKTNAYIELMKYFRGKVVVDLSKEVDMTKSRIVFIED